jgi:hypothetical protein
MCHRLSHRSKKCAILQEKINTNMENDAKAQHFEDLLHNLRDAADALLNFVEEEGVDSDMMKSAAQAVRSVGSTVVDGKVVEGIFDGVHMLGLDGKQYTIPANYASKSKLVEGDRLKLTIATDGTFIYKQVGPIERERKMGTLTKEPTTGAFLVESEGKVYRVLQASVTFYDGDTGDEVVILVPEGKSARWAAIENIIKH